MTDKKITTREANRVLTAELLAALKHFAQSQTEFMERVAGQVVNNTLKVWSGVFPADGIIEEEFQVAAGCIEVNHLGAAGNILTVSSAGRGGSAAPTGTGTYAMAGGTRRTVALASRQVTLYGTAGDRVSYQVFTAPLRPGTGP